MVEDERDKIARDVTINDAPPAIRNHLTKRTTQDDIARRTGTVVTVKGRYYSPGDPQDENEKPLYLRITPGQCMQDVCLCLPTSKFKPWKRTKEC
jgi:hypothetical protein